MRKVNRQYLLNNLWFRENSREENRRLYKVLLYDGGHEYQVATLLPDLNRVWGIDISHWNGLTDLAVANARGCSFVIIKAADGSVPTRWFQENKQRAKEVELPWGAYVWLYPDSKVPVKDQVAMWWDLVKDDYPPVAVHIDFEWTKYGGQPANPNASDLKKALDGFEAVSGKLAEVYTAKGYADQYLVGFPNPERYKWWIANYGVMQPNMPKLLVEKNVPWKKWQFTSSLDGEIAPCQILEIDGNYYAGDHYQFAAEYLGGELPPPNGGTMPKYYKWTGTKANIRTGPGTGFTDRGDILTNDVIQVDEPKSGSWFAYTLAQRADGSWVTLVDGTEVDGAHGKYFSTDSYFVEVPALPKPLPPPPPPPPLLHVLEVYMDGVLKYREEFE